MNFFATQISNAEKKSNEKVEEIKENVNTPALNFYVNNINNAIKEIKKRGY